MCRAGSFGTIDAMTNPLMTRHSTPAGEHTVGPSDGAQFTPMWATRIARVLTGALALFLISSGAAKFGGGHIFQYIEYKSGIEFFHPFANAVVGAAEVVAGGLILFRRIRLAGAMVASFVMVDAVGFHLSPWLGVSVPTGLTEDATAPWTADDFVATTTVVPFSDALSELSVGVCAAFCAHAVAGALDRYVQQGLVGRARCQSGKVTLSASPRPVVS